MAILLALSISFTIYFHCNNMHGAAIGAAIVAAFVLVLWIGEL